MRIRTFVTAVFVCVSCGLFAQTEWTIDSLKRCAEKSKGNDKISALMELSMYYLNESPQKSFEAAHKAYYYAAFTANPTMLSKSYFTLGMLHYKTSTFDSATFYMRQALKTCDDNDQNAVILDNMGMIYKDLSRYDSAIIFHNQALKLQQTLGNRKAVSDCYKNIGNVYMQQSKFNDALSFYEQSMNEMSREKDQKSIAALCNNISTAYVSLNKYSEALSYLTKAVNIQNEIGDKAGEAYTLNSIGNFYFRLKVYDKAQEYYTRSLELRTKLGDNNDIAASQFNIATVHRDLENYHEALKYYNRALELRQQTDNKEAQALILNAIGGTYKNQMYYDKAIEYYQKALEINQNIGSQKSIASSYERLGMVYRDTCLALHNSVEESNVGAQEKSELENNVLSFYKNAIDAYQKIGDSLNVARVYNFLGNFYKDMNELRSAMVSYDSAIKFYGKNTLGIAYATYNQAKIMHQGNNPEAEKYYLKAMDMAEQCSEKTLVCDVVNSLSQWMKQHKNPEKALQYYEKFVELKDELAVDKNKERIAELEFEADIKMLEQANENQELKLREEELKHSHSQFVIIFLLLILCAIAICAYLIYKQYSQKKQAFSMLSKKQKEVEKAYCEVKTTNETLEKKNEQILNSLSYAKRIQKAILPPIEDLNNAFPQNFVFYMPKEIVSGDFYWLSKNNDYIFFAVVDCTGHGIPGACMSMIGNTLLNQIVNENNVTDPAEILKMLDKEVIKNLRQDEGENTQEDGMNISLIRYDKKNAELIFAGAGQNMLVVSNGDVQTVAASLFSVGGMHALKQNKDVVFENTTVPVVDGMTLYLFSDGFIDQFGGENNERFSLNRFEDMILEMQSMDMSEQYMEVSRELDAWKGEEKQIDDILVVGIKF